MEKGKEIKDSFRPKKRRHYLTIPFSDLSDHAKGKGDSSKFKKPQGTKRGTVTIKLTLDSLQIIAKFKDRKALERYYSEVLRAEKVINPDIFMSMPGLDDIYWSLCADIIHAVEFYKKKVPRGMHKSTHSLISYIKLDAGILYAYLSAWNKRPLSNRPEFIKKIIRMAKDEYCHNVKGITEYCIKRIYEEEINQYQLKTLNDPTNFYQTYILAEKDMVKNLKSHFKKLTPQVLAFQVYVYPSLKKIFETLQVI